MKTLITDRLKLRQWQENDSSDLHEFAKSELVGPNAGWPAHKDEEKSREIIKMFIQSNDTYAIVLKSENKVIGSIGIHDRKPDITLSDLIQKEIGYVLNPKYWGNEFIPEAVNRLIKYGFDELNLDLIWCGHYDYNNNSKRVIEKCGFNYKIQKTKRIELLDNKEFTTLYYNIFKHEYYNKLIYPQV